MEVQRFPWRIFNTDGDSACTAIVDTSPGIAACVLAAQHVTLTGGDAFKAMGSRPLVIIGALDMAIDGTLSASSTRIGLVGPGANGSACPGSTRGGNNAAFHHRHDLWHDQ